MSEYKKLIPKRRFKRFEKNEQWLTDKLSSMTEFSKGKGYSKNDLCEYGIPILLYGRLYTQYETVINSVDTFVKNKKDSIVFSSGNEVVVPASGETSKDIARASFIEKSGIIIGGDLNIIKPKDRVCPTFLAISLSNGMQKNELIKRAQGKTVVHLHNSDLKEVYFIFPTKNEQIQIGNFFKKIDNLIQTQRKKLQKIKTLKLAYLAEMFPCDGELKPKLRFKGFSDNWECKPLFTITNHRGGIAIERYFSSEGRYKVISIGSYGLDGQYIDQNIRVLANEKTNGLLVKKNELTMVLNDKTLNGSIIGRVLLIDENDTYVINQRTEIISPKDFFESRFAYVALNNNFREKVKKIVQGGTQIYVNYTFVENLYIEIPTINEQTKIGNFFKLLDSKIALEQKKLEKLNNIKQAYLNEMFV